MADHHTTTAGERGQAIHIDRSPLTSSSQAFDAVAAALHAAATSVAAAQPLQAESARLIRLGRMNDALPTITECLSLWQDVQRSLTAAGAAIGQPVEKLAALVLTPSGSPAGDPVGELKRTLQTISRTVQDRDWIGLADAFEYDLGDLAQRWRAALLQPDEVDQTKSEGRPELSRSAPAA